MTSDRGKETVEGDRFGSEAHRFGRWPICVDMPQKSVGDIIDMDWLDHGPGKNEHGKYWTLPNYGSDPAKETAFGSPEDEAGSNREPAKASNQGLDMPLGPAISAGS